MGTKSNRLADLVEFLKTFRDEKSWKVGKSMTADDGSEATCFIGFEKGDSVWVSYAGGVCSIIQRPERENMKPIDYVRSPFREIRKMFAIENYFYPGVVEIDGELVIECLRSKDDNLVMFGLKWLDKVDIIDSAISFGNVGIKYEYFMKHKDFKKIPWRQEYKKIAMELDIPSVVNHKDFMLSDEELEGFALGSPTHLLCPSSLGFNYIKNLKITQLNRGKVEDIVFRSGHKMQSSLLENRTYRPSEKYLEMILRVPALCEIMLLRVDLEISSEKISSALEIHKEMNSIWCAAAQRNDFLPSEKEERHGRCFTHQVSNMFKKREDEWGLRREKSKLMLNAGISEVVSRKTKRSI
jgi:hypothetical protein